MYSAYTRSVSKALRYSTHCQGITQFYLFIYLFIYLIRQMAANNVYTLRFIRKQHGLCGMIRRRYNIVYVGEQ